MVGPSTRFDLQVRLFCMLFVLLLLRGQSCHAEVLDLPSYTGDATISACGDYIYTAQGWWSYESQKVTDWGMSTKYHPISGWYPEHAWRTHDKVLLYHYIGDRGHVTDGARIFFACDGKPQGRMDSIDYSGVYSDRGQFVRGRRSFTPFLLAPNAEFGLCMRDHVPPRGPIARDDIVRSIAMFDLRQRKILWDATDLPWYQDVLADPGVLPLAAKIHCFFLDADRLVIAPCRHGNVRDMTVQIVDPLTGAELHRYARENGFCRATVHACHIVQLWFSDTAPVFTLWNPRDGSVVHRGKVPVQTLQYSGCKVLAFAIGDNDYLAFVTRDDIPSLRNQSEHSSTVHLFDCVALEWLGSRQGYAQDITYLDEVSRNGIWLSHAPGPKPSHGPNASRESSNDPMVSCVRIDLKELFADVLP